MQGVNWTSTGQRNPFPCQPACGDFDHLSVCTYAVTRAAANSSPFSATRMRTRSGNSGNRLFRAESVAFAVCASTCDFPSTTPGRLLISTRPGICPRPAPFRPFPFRFLPLRASADRVFHQQAGPRGCNCRGTNGSPPAGPSSAIDPKSDTGCILAPTSLKPHAKS